MTTLLLIVRIATAVALVIAFVLQGVAIGAPRTGSPDSFRRRLLLSAGSAFSLAISLGSLCVALFLQKTTGTSMLACLACSVVGLLSLGWVILQLRERVQG